MAGQPRDPPAPDDPSWTFHGLLAKADLVGVRELDIPCLLDRAREQLEAADPPPDAIVGYWDFPVSSMVPIRCRERGLASASLESGDRLSELVLQEPFSHELAQVFVAVADAEELVTTYRRAVEAMGIVVDHDRRR